MLTLARNGFTAQAVTDALIAGSGARTLKFRYDLLDGTNTYIKPITTMLSGSIANDDTATIRGTARFKLIDDISINWLQARIKPYICVLMPNGKYAEFPGGIYLLSTPEQISDPTGGMITRQIEGYDQTQVLTDNKATDRYSIAAGTLYTTAVTTLLTAAGFTAPFINTTPSTLTLPVVQEWPIATTYLKIIDDLLKAINYDPLWFSLDGIAQIAPTVLATVKPSVWTYSDDDQSVIIPGMVRTYDLFSIPNVFVLVVSDPARPTALRSVYTNSNSLSPVSTVQRGRSIVSVDTSQQAPDQTTLDALAQKAAFNASQVYEKLKLTTMIMPMHEHADVITINHSKLGVSANYAETGWSYNLAAGSQMQHIVQRISPV